MTTLDKIKKHRKEILAMAEKYGVDNVRVFGSVAREEDGPRSDIDFLVNIEDGKSMFDLMDFQYAMKDLLGRKCDVLTEQGIHWYIKDKIIEEARPL